MRPRSHVVELNLLRLAPSRALLFGAVIAGCALRVHFGLRDHGIYWPDEIYQSLEPAHRLVYGYGLLPWEFVEGARSWAFPGIVAGILWMARAVGLDAPEQYLTAVRLVFIAGAAATALGVDRLARALGATHLTAAAGASVFALAGPFIYFGHRALSETASALPLVFGLGTLVRAWGSAIEHGRRSVDRSLVAGASLLGIAVLLRLQNAIFCAGVLAILAARRRWRDALVCGATFAAWAIVYGALDEWTWGGWFRSAIRYLQFNVIEGRGEQWGVAPATWYFRVMWTAMPVPLATIGAGVLLSAPGAPGLLLTAVAFFVLHSATAHKELRFILPVIPVLCALASFGWSWISRRTTETVGAVAAVLLALSAAVSGVTAGSLTFGRLGAYESLRPQANAWGDFAEINQLLLIAARQPDLCGLKMEAVHQAWSGGYTYLHTDVPFYAHNGPPRGTGRFNYVVTGVASGDVIARRGPYSLVRLGRGCVADPAFTSRLP